MRRARRATARGEGEHTRQAGRGPPSRGKKRGRGSLRKERRRCRRTASGAAPIVGARWRREVRRGEKNTCHGEVREEHVLQVVRVIPS
jgi:hypothetical protein